MKPLKRKPYPSDLTEREWKLIETLVPKPKSGGRPAEYERREIVNGVWYVLRSGCAWRMMPHDLPDWQSVYQYFRHWKKDGTWKRIHDTLRGDLREEVGRERQASAGSADTQTVKTTDRGGVKGYDGAKKIKGRKRHILVDTMGLLISVLVHAADLNDREELKKLFLGTAAELLERLVLIWVDQGYVSNKLAAWLLSEFGVKMVVVQRPPKWVWVMEGQEPPVIPSGFIVLPRRWVAERTFAWIGKYRRMSKDYEFLTDTSETMIYCSMIHMMARRLALIRRLKGR